MQYQNYRPKLDPASFNKIKQFITQNYGIKLEDSKKTLVETRVGSRLSQLGMSSYSQYIDYVFKSNNQEEKKILTDLISTNKTDFFREPDHFEYMVNDLLPAFIATYGQGTEIRVWSSACSSGEEVYTLAMLLEEFRQQQRLRYTLHGSDISNRMLEKARAGVYRLRDIVPVADHLKRKYLMRSRDPGSDLVKVKPELRDQVKFDYHNLMNQKYNRGKYHIIFCRNVLIYFDHPTQEQVIRKLSDQLHVGGFLFIGHSETIMGMKTDLVRVKPTVYQKVDGK